MENQNENIENDNNSDSSDELLQVFDHEIGVVRPTEMPFNFREQGTRWQEKYGITEVPLLCKSVDGKLYDDKRLKGVFFNGNYRRMVSRYYVVVPNEEVEEMVNEVIKRSEEIDEFSPLRGLKLQERYSSHYGDAKYWQLINERISENIEYAGKDDTVQIGCIVRNSVGAKVALGADLYTHRVVCGNGAVARGKDMGFALKHVGTPERLLKDFMEGIEKVLTQSVELVEFYRKAAKLRVTKKIADEWGKRLPQSVFPNCMKIDKNNGNVILTQQDVNLWQAFNEITETTWHNNKSHYLTKSHVEQNAHRVLINAVEGKYD